ncbi:MAG: lamin tail domain-containing protein [Pirellulales bacterium]
MTKFSFGGKKHRSAKSGTGRMASRRSLQVEHLEDRQMLANNPLVITEINYHPGVPQSGAFDKDQYEYVEFYNAGDTALTIAGVQFATIPASINFTFPAGTTLAAGAYTLIVKDAAAMAERYGAGIASQIAGVYTGSLSNSNARLQLSTPFGVNENQLISFEYDDGNNAGETFPDRADGDGSSLQLINPSKSVDAAYYNDPTVRGANWRASREFWGSPGRAGLEDAVEPRVVINEILANSNALANPAEYDKIELVNISNDPVDLSGWIITDMSDNEFTVPVVGQYLGGYKIPDGTILQPGQYISFAENLHFGDPINGVNEFGLSSGGERLYLTSKEADGLRLFEDIIDYDSTRQSQSIGRAPDKTGSFLPMQTQTFGVANSNHALSPIVITEIMYNRSTPNTDLNYIELHNRSGSAVTLGGAGANDRWKIDGIGYTFPANTTIPINTTFLVVPFNPTTDTAKRNAFLLAYGLATAPTMYGPFPTSPSTASLSSTGERLRLTQFYSDPGPPVAVTDVLVDSVNFDNDSPWPEGPAGGIATTNYSLTRVALDNVGDQPHSWRGAAPTPGSVASLPSTTSPLAGLVISELSYNPLPAEFGGGDLGSNNHLEFIELFNTTGATLNISDAGVRQGVNYTFPTGTTIAAGERILVVPFNPDPSNLVYKPQRDAFLNDYGLTLGDVDMFGPWVGSLNNGGESIALIDRTRNTFFEFTYNDRGGWPDRAAGKGSSLELINPSAVPVGVTTAAAYLNAPTNWRASTELRGSPGSAGVGPVAASVVINEINSHTDPPNTDAIELFNASGAPINLSNWVLTDDMTKNPSSTWFYLPPVTLNPGEYITFDASPAGFNTRFNLNAAEGERVYLLAFDSSTFMSSFADDVEFPATFSNVSLGRWPNGTGEMFPMESRTLSQVDTFPEFPAPGETYTNGANSGPKFDDVVISEVMYNPLGPNPNDFEYIELQNRRGIPIPLGPIEAGIGWGSLPEGWRLRGSVDFDFTSAHTIPALGTMVMVSFDPAASPAKATAFRSRYGIGVGVALVGPFNLFRTIPDDGGVIRLEKPDAAPTTLPDAEKFTPNILVDRVTYDDAAPWPTSPDGTGQSLTRLGSSEYGDLASSWSGANPTPGSISQSAAAPRVTNVILSSTSWNAAFNTAVSSPGSPVQGYTALKGSQQATAVPWSGVNQVSVTFDRAVTISSNALAIRGLSTANYSVSPTPTNPAGFTYTWTITPAINSGDKILIELDDAKVNSSGALLDGEWTDNVSNGNSGNGIAGGDFRFRMNVLPGDADGNGTVNNDDFVGVRAAMFTSPGVGPYDVRRDLNASGMVTVVDWIVARNKQGQSLPAGTPSSPAAPEAPSAIVAQADRATTRRVGNAPLRAVARAAAVDRVLAGSLSSGAAEGSGDRDTGQSPLSALRARRAARAVSVVDSQPDTLRRV